MIFFASIGMLSSCSKENEKETKDNESIKYVGRWETTEVVFDFSYDYNIYNEVGESDVHISNWKNKTDVPQYVVMREDGTFSMKRKYKTIDGDWNYSPYSDGIYESMLDFNYDYQDGGCRGLSMYVLSITEQTMRVTVYSVEVDAGVLPEYEGLKPYPRATLTLMRL